MVTTTSNSGAVAVHESTAYFSKDYSVYSYTLHESEWTKLPLCKHKYFAMAVINDALTTIGGWAFNREGTTNTLFSLSGSSWEKVIPSMPTKRVYPAVANTPTHLVVAGGMDDMDHRFVMKTVEVLNSESLQWSTVTSVPKIGRFSQMTTCSGHLYLTAGKDIVVSCSVEDLLESTNNSDGSSVWIRLTDIPTKWSNLATRRGHVLAIGGADQQENPTGAIHCYNVAADSWSVIGEMPTPRYDILTAVLPSNELVVVGGMWRERPAKMLLYPCSITDIGTFHAPEDL